MKVVELLGATELLVLLYSEILHLVHLPVTPLSPPRLLYPPSSVFTRLCCGNIRVCQQAARQHERQWKWRSAENAKLHIETIGTRFSFKLANYLLLWDIQHPMVMLSTSHSCSKQYTRFFCCFITFFRKFYKHLGQEVHKSIIPTLNWRLWSIFESNLPNPWIL